MKIKYQNIILLLISTFLGAVGQFFFKFSLSNKLIFAFVFGLIIYGVSSLIYFYVISKAHISWAYGMGGFSYIFAVILASTFIEKIPLLRWIGVIIITSGVFFIIIS